MAKLSRLFAAASFLAAMTSPAWALPGGVLFSCADNEKPEFVSQVKQYLADIGVDASVVEAHDTGRGLQFVLAPRWADVSPLDFYLQPELDLRDEMVSLPKGEGGQLVAVQTVSRKEIALALMHPGRLTESPCDLNEFKDHVGIRQNIAAWSEKLYWNWPEGGPAQWNTDSWHKGTPTSDTLTAFYDAFQQQDKYSIGCYTATKMVVTQGVLDYYARVRPDAALLSKVMARLHADKDPLVTIEPPVMWKFEAEYDANDEHTPGKLLRLQQNVKPMNFVPGDWAYILNTDPISYEKTGYEGSNAIYLGRGKFDDYYNDHSNSYSYRQKLNEVYQWRNGVYSRNRDGHKVTPLSEKDYQKLSKPPEEGGLVLTYRAVPYFFNELSH